MNSIQLKYRSLLGIYVPLFVVVSIVLTACGGDATPTAIAPSTVTPGTNPGLADTAPAPTQASAMSNKPVPEHSTLTPASLDRRIVATIPVGAEPGVLAEGADMIWLNTDDGLQKIDPATNQVSSIATVSKPGPMLVSDGSLWVVDGFEPQISGGLAAVLKKVDPATGAVKASIDVSNCCTGMAATDGAIWLANFDASKVMKVSTQTNSVVATIPATGPLNLAVGGGSVWVTNHHSYANDSILRVDQNSNAVTAKIDVGSSLAAGGIIYTDNAVWVTSWDRDTDNDVISRVDPQTNAVVATITYSTNLDFSLASSAGSVWTAAKDNMLLRVDPQTNKIVEKIKVGQMPFGLLATGSTLWVANSGDSTVMKLDLTR